MAARAATGCGAELQGDRMRQDGHGDQASVGGEIRISKG
jgi:hypothetical protein